MIETALNSQQMSPTDSRSPYIPNEIEQESEPTPIKRQDEPANSRFFSAIKKELK